MADQADDRNARPPGAVRLEDRARVAGLYYHALTRRQPAFHLLEDLTPSLVPPDTDDTLRLPAEIDWFPDAQGNWDWYVVALSHRAMAHHPTLGTYAPLDEDRTGRDAVREFLAGCPSPALGRAVLSIVEGLRLDAVLARVLPGLRPALRRVHAHALDSVDRSAMADLPPRSQLLATLLTATLLDGPLTVPVAPVVAAALEECGPLLDRLAAAPPLPQALTVTAHMYRIVATLPPMAGVGTAQDVVLDQPVPAASEDALPPLAAVRDRASVDVKLEGMEQFGDTVPEVLYRGVIGTQHLDHRDSGRLADPAILAWRDGIEGDDHHHDHHHGPAPHAEEHEEDGKPPEPIAHEHGEVPRWEVPHVPPVAVGGSNVFHYPEWDGVRGAYRADWCRVVEEPLEPAAFTPYGRQVLDAHRPTVTRLLREWTRLPREGLTLARALPDGDEIDLEAAIDLRASLRAGSPASSNVYTRKVPLGRDVVCGVLVDVSMSTADHIEPSPDEPFTVDETAVRLYGRPYRTVLDHQRETAVLMAEIMERVSDLSMIWSFSSTGRNLVRLQRIKGVRDRAGTATASRLQKLRPLDATRMGAAVRHASAQLRRTDARSKMLVVISDGLPYDEDYGAEYGSRKDAYAISDTVRAFDEAESAGIRSVLFLTGDQDAGQLSALGSRSIQVPHPADLAAAVMTRYLDVRGGMRGRGAIDHRHGNTDNKGER